MTTFAKYKTEIKESNDEFSKGVEQGLKLSSEAVARVFKKNQLTATSDEKKELKRLVNDIANEFQRIKTGSMGLDPKKFARNAS